MNATRPAVARTGTAITIAVIAFLSFDTITHIANPSVVRTAMRDLGFDNRAAPIIGIIELVCVALYAWRRTAPLGAVLLTGFLGGAVAVNLRADQPMLSTTLFPIYVGVAVWAGLAIRHADIRSMLTSLVRRPDPGDQPGEARARPGVTVGASQ